MYAYGTDKQPQGAALVIVMLVMAVLLLAGTTFMTISSTESQIALNERVSVQATLIAEAAIHKAIAQLNANTSYPGESNTGLGGGNFTSTVTTAAAQPCGGATAKDVVATARVPVPGGQAQVTIKATADQISYPYRWGAFAAVDYLFLSSLTTKLTVTDSFDSSRGSYDQSKNLLAGGNIGANGGLYLWNVDIKGSAQSGAWISTDGNSTASPPPVSNVPLRTLPNVLPSGSASSIAPITTNTSLSPGTYVTPSINMPDSKSITTDSGPVTLYVTGSVTLGKDVTLGSENLVAGSPPATNLTIITKSDGDGTQSVNFIAGNNFRLFGSLYGKNTNIILGDNAKVYGSMIGRKITRGTTTGEYTGNWSEKPSIFHFD
ncbi:MAG TPA: PilX N-terminal domain-containing pilus assembly protein, partial [Candidatus Methylomirabilis sp.]|nr:PilX N-terminal domain-containing pilus assembly protein [Candidatus Methylomirabilis sp.]